MRNSNKAFLEKINKSNLWQYYKKTKPLWAKKLEEDMTVKTLEGNLKYKKGDYLCKGPSGDVWGQKERSLFKKYDPDPKSKPSEDGWQKFIPKPDSKGVMAAQIDHEFSIKHPEWGTFHGNPGDYLVKSFEDKEAEFPEDVWIVQKGIFEGTYNYFKSKLNKIQLGN